MPVAGQRDPEETRRTLVEWLGRRILGARDVDVPELTIPQASGFSNETFLFDATWSDADGEHRKEFVLRAQPAEYGLFPHIDILEQQYRTMQLVGENIDVPVPRVQWPEADTSVLGQPFFVMDRVHGQVPGDSPPYTADGFVLELAADERRALYESGLEAMTRVHRADWRAIGFDHLDRPRYGRSGAEQLRGYFEHFTSWALEGEPHPVLDPAWTWLADRWPSDDEYVGLTWGDARIGNQMFLEGRCVGVFDWEMAALANPESDLGWWIYMQRYHTEGYAMPLPEGFFDREAIIAFWEDRVGRRAEYVDFYEALGGYHFSLIMVMLAKNMDRIMPGLLPEGFAVTNPGPQVLAKILGL